MSARSCAPGWKRTSKAANIAPPSTMARVMWFDSLATAKPSRSPSASASACTASCPSGARRQVSRGRGYITLVRHVGIIDQHRLPGLVLLTEIDISRSGPDRLTAALWDQRQLEPTIFHGHFTHHLDLDDDRHRGRCSS